MTIPARHGNIWRWRHTRGDLTNGWTFDYSNGRLLVVLVVRVSNNRWRARGRLLNRSHCRGSRVDFRGGSCRPLQENLVASVEGVGRDTLPLSARWVVDCK